MFTTLFALLLCVGSGAIGSVFFAFSTFVMRALSTIAAEAGISAMQRINVVVLNRVFLGVFVGTATIAAATIVVAGQSRIVTFFNGMTAKELIVTIDDAARRVVWSAVGGRLTHHNASAQVHAAGANACRVEWIADLLPDELAPAIEGMIERGLAAMKRNAEHQGAA